MAEQGPYDIQGCPISSGQRVAFATIGRGSNHGGDMSCGRVNDCLETPGGWQVVIDNRKTGRTIVRKASAVAVLVVY